jgi:ATP-dependent Lhr-like helicase
MNLAQTWFKQKGWKPHTFQKETWAAIKAGKSGLLNAPTGFGKTFAIWFGVIQHFQDHPKPKENKLHCLYISPLRALSKEIFLATNRVSHDLGLPYSIELRTGDSSMKDRTRQKKDKHQALITTPESMHLMLAAKGYQEQFSNLEFVIIDEWHELLGSKRGVQIELALAHLKAMNPNLKVWGISATIGNMEQAKDILLGPISNRTEIIKANLEKKITINTVLPDEIEKFPWGGHLGLKLLPKLVPIIEESKSTLLFTNMRSQAETWYQQLLEQVPDLAGRIALHHSSIDSQTRKWVEEHLHSGDLKIVVCTSSLDLGVDFRPVDTIIQVGSAKGVARFIQRAGRSGHSPGEKSKIYFVPTNSLEIVEGSALKDAVKHQLIESRIPYIRSFDVLIQFMVTLGVSEGFQSESLYHEIKTTHAFQSVTPEEWQWCLDFITRGGQSLGAYDEFHKVVLEDGLYKVTSKGIAARHRMNIGTIVGTSMMNVKVLGGKQLGTIEEAFISRLKPGDVFWFAGRNLALHSVKDMTAIVRASKEKNGIIPSWLGGKMPLSSQLSSSIRKALTHYKEGGKLDEELKKLKPLFELQEETSHLPGNDELLIEKIKTREGYHLFIYPFDGRLVHEGMATILSYRISMLTPVTFSISMNDYGFELLSDQDINVEDLIDNNLFSEEFVYEDAIRSINSSQMAQRRFRDIASIAGLVFTGYPGQEKKTRHLQASSQLFFKVFEDNEDHNLLLLQAYDEVIQFELEISRQQAAFKRIGTQKIVVTYPTKPTPFCFAIMVARFREFYSNEPIEVRVEKLLKQIEKK